MSADVTIVLILMIKKWKQSKNPTANLCLSLVAQLVKNLPAMLGIWV